MADFMRGEELKRLREGKSLSQEELAAQLHVTTKTVRSWEKGGSIRPANARTVGTYFKVDPAELVRHELDTPDPFTAPNSSNGNTDLSEIKNWMQALTEAVVPLLAQAEAERLRQLADNAQRPPEEPPESASRPGD